MKCNFESSYTGSKPVQHKLRKEGQSWKVWENFGLHLAKTGFFLEFEVVKKKWVARSKIWVANRIALKRNSMKELF